MPQQILFGLASILAERTLTEIAFSELAALPGHFLGLWQRLRATILNAPTPAPLDRYRL